MFIVCKFKKKRKPSLIEEKICVLNDEKIYPVSVSRMVKGSQVYKNEEIASYKKVKSKLLISILEMMENNREYIRSSVHARRVLSKWFLSQVHLEPGDAVELYRARAHSPIFRQGFCRESGGELFARAHFLFADVIFRGRDIFFILNFESRELGNRRRFKGEYIVTHDENDFLRYSEFSFQKVKNSK